MEKLKEAENYISTDPSESVKIYRNSSLKFHREALTLPQLFDNAVKAFPKNAALKYKKDQQWASISYEEYKNQVKKIAKAFIKLGLQPHGCVAVLAFNCPEWFISQLAAIHAGGYIAGIYTSNSAELCRYILESTRANIVVVDEDEQLNKILSIKDKLPHLKSIIKILPPCEVDDVYSWKDVEELNTDDFNEEYEKRLSDVSSNQCCCISFTSGTTGKPKGVMMSHDNFIWNIQNITEVLSDLKVGEEILVSYLPLSHVAAQVADIFLSISLAGTVHFADKNALKGSLLTTLIETRPTFFFAVPRVYEKIQEKFQQSLFKVQGYKQSLISWSQNVATQYHLNRMNGNEAFSIRYELAKYFILNKIKQGLGLDKAKICLVGAAPSNEETLKFVSGIDLNLVEAYGMTEASGVLTLTSKSQAKFGSVGKCHPNAEIKILNPDGDGIGEVCMRGRNIFMGYINELEKTKEALDNDGWLHSGDLGYFDKDGYLFVTGRIKELIITAGGENIPYLHIENLIKKECSAISNAVLIGDKRKFLTMLITLKTEVDSNLAPTDDLAPDTLKLVKELNVTKLSEAHNNPRVIALIQAAVDRANKNAIANFQKVQKFAILPHEFSIASGEFSPTMKLKRGFLLEKYADIIDKFYN